MRPPADTAVGSMGSSLQETIERVLGPFVAPGSRAALLHFPNHGNAGDSAIWLGERKYLARAGIRLLYAAEAQTYSAESLRRALGDGTIFLSGGGDLGDVWPEVQHMREDVIRSFPDRRIVQLPQSVNFTRRSTLDRARRTFNEHPDLTLLVRDRRSLEIARDEFGVRTLLCPDMAFALGPLVRAGSPRYEVLWLARRDRESAARAVAQLGRGVVRTDWLKDERRWSARRLQDSLAFRGPRFLGRRADGSPRLSRPMMRLLLRTYDAAARYRLGRGCRLLGRGRVVITDRLHGHILSLMMGIPHVLVDDRYGKVRAFHDTWTGESPFVEAADDPFEAVERATRMGVDAGARW